MADVTLSIGGRSYTVSCRDGEEPRLREIGALVDAKAKSAREALGDGLGEARQLLYAALLLADELEDMQANGGAPDPAKLEDLAGRLEALSLRLAPAADAT